MKQKKKHCTAAFILALLMLVSLWGRFTQQQQAVICCSAMDTQHKLIPVGRAVGIKLFANGVMVVQLSAIQTSDGACTPAKSCGLKEGDMITAINGIAIDSAADVTNALNQSANSELCISASRDGKSMTLDAYAACAVDGTYKLGAWVRDSMAGIGTVTWYDPQTGQFAALGHGISDVDTGRLMPLKSGSIMSASVSAILRGTQGQPGVLHGTFDLTCDLGTLYTNTNCGIFGHAESDCFSGNALPVATRSDISTGKAVILCNLEGETVSEYDVEILRIYPEGCTGQRNLMLRVIDDALLERTGGIVQGMSGSPILQNGKLVGAVTHVLVGDPTCGYGILAETMLEAESSAGLA